MALFPVLRRSAVLPSRSAGSSAVLRRHLVRSLRHRHEANPDEQTGDIHLLGFDHQRSSTAGLTIFFDLRAVVVV